MKTPARVAFSDKDIRGIEAALRPHATPSKLAKLRPLLRTWSQVELAEYLAPRPSRQANAARNKRLSKVSAQAEKLLSAIHVLSEDDLIAVSMAMARLRPQSRKAARRALADWKPYNERLKEEAPFLKHLSVGAAQAVYKVNRRNVPAYLVMLDAAEIFRFMTGKVPSRQVDRTTGKETGPFWFFLMALWPAIFGDGISGLRAAMQSWYAARRFSERSALIANLTMQGRW
jgi:hypothetical protein